MIHLVYDSIILDIALSSPNPKSQLYAEVNK